MPSTKTKYVIMRLLPEHADRPGDPAYREGWTVEFEDFEADSRDRAVEGYVSRLIDADLTTQEEKEIRQSQWVAIPVSSWNPTVVTVERETKVAVKYPEKKRAKAEPAGATT